jgi:hypothetical protein
LLLALHRSSSTDIAMNGFRIPLLALIVLASFIPSGCNRANVRQVMDKHVPDVNGSPKIIADYQPWFGDPAHIQIGYNSQDPAVIRKQIEQAKNMGIHAFVVDWYGDRHPFLDRSYAIMQQIASQTDFKVALMYDETEEDNGHATEDALQAFDKAYKSYIGPGAPARSAYLLYQGRPLIFIFPKRGNTDWDQVRQAVNAWETPPWLIYKDDPPAKYAKNFDGQYAWVHPDKGWAPDGSDWGKKYLEDFYVKMKTKYPDKIAVGGAWPGFDDSKASWSLNRKMDARCGKTFEDTLKMFRRYYDDSHPLPFLMIATWNDYEEGTAIEEGLARCEGTQKKNDSGL